MEQKTGPLFLAHVVVLSISESPGLSLRVQVKVTPPDTHTLQQSQPGGWKWIKPPGFGNRALRGAGMLGFFLFFFFFLGQDTLNCPPSLPQLEEDDKSS